VTVIFFKAASVSKYKLIPGKYFLMITVGGDRKTTRFVRKPSKDVGCLCGKAWVFFYLSFSRYGKNEKRVPRYEQPYRP
jgi:hypothetical protein